MKFVIILIFICLLGSLSAQNPWLGRDKVTHFAASTFLTCWNFGVSYDYGQQNRKDSLIFSVSLTTILGMGKEFSDKNILKTEWSWHDIVYNLAGIGAGLILINNMR